MKSKQERTRIFYERLAAADAAQDFHEAYDLLCRTLTAVEDDFSGVPDQSANWLRDGRLYPPQMDQSEYDELRQLTRFRTVAHRVFISNSGAITILSLQSGAIEFQKAGQDGLCLDSEHIA